MISHVFYQSFASGVTFCLKGDLMSGRPNTLLSRKYKWAQPGKSVTRWPCNMTVSAHLITHRMTGVKLKAHGVENRGADFRSRKSESFLHDMRSESRFRFSTPKIGASFRPRVSSALGPIADGMGKENGEGNWPPYNPFYQNQILSKSTA